MLGVGVRVEVGCVRGIAEMMVDETGLSDSGLILKPGSRLVDESCKEFG